MPVLHIATVQSMHTSFKFLGINTESESTKTHASVATPAVITIFLPRLSNLSPLSRLVSAESLRSLVNAKPLSTKTDASVATPAVITIFLPRLSNLLSLPRLVSAESLRCRLRLSPDSPREGDSSSSSCCCCCPGSQGTGWHTEGSTEPLSTAGQELISAPAGVAVLLPALPRLSRRSPLVGPAQVAA